MTDASVSGEDIVEVAIDRDEGLEEDDDEGTGTLQAELADGRVIVGEIRCIDEGDVECPIEWCLRRFESKGSLNFHISWRHPEENERTCEHCGDVFASPPSSNNRFCSWQCKTNENQLDRSCRVCGDPFTTYRSNDNEYCSRECFYVLGNIGERPESPGPLIRDIRRDGFTGSKLESRIYAHLSSEWDRLDVAIAVLVSRDGPPADIEAILEDIRDRDDFDELPGSTALLDRVVRITCQVTNDSIDHVGAEEFLAVLQEASTLLEVQQAWRVGRMDARQITERLGIMDAVSSGEGAAIKRAREMLESDDESFGPGDPVWEHASTTEGQADD